MGTSRTLTLPGGRQVTVSVPAGGHDGQVVRLEGQGEASPDGGEAGALVLTIRVVAAQIAPPFSPENTPEAEATLLTAEPTVLAPGTPTVSDASQQPTVGSTVHAEQRIPTTTEVTPTEVAPSASQGLFPPAPLYIYRGHSSSVYAVAWSPDGRHIASGGYDNMVRVWLVKV